MSAQGDCNLGDEAIFEAAELLLPDCSLLRYNSDVGEQIVSNIGLSGRPYFCGAILSGGTLINPTWFDIATRAVRQHLPISLLGTGVGSPDVRDSEPQSFANWAPVLKKFHFLGVRGPRSASKLKKIGLNNVVVVGDAAFALAPDVIGPVPSARKFAVNSHLIPQRYTAGSFDGLEYLPFVVQELVSQGWEPVPVAMHPKDIEITRRLLTGISIGTDEVEHQKTAAQYFAKIKDCSFVLSTRLHASILGACIGVVPIMLSTIDKCMDFMDSVGLEEYAVDCNAATLTALIDKAIQVADESGAKRTQLHAISLTYRDGLRTYGKAIAETFSVKAKQGN